MSGKTLILAGVAGWPVHHSLSPLMHSHWIKQLNKLGQPLNGAYTMFAVRPDEAIHAFQSLKHTSITGLNITIPLKKLAFEAADKCTSDAERLGVCNILYKKNGKLIGHNTDMQGFTIPLMHTIGAKELLNMTVCIIGTGGVARAALGALLGLGVSEIRLLGRTDATAIKLANHINTPNLQAWSWTDRQKAIRSSNLIVNATSAGMKDMPALDIDLSSVAKNTVIYDLVYTPRTTPLLAQAEKLGLKTIEGIDMLISQARPSFEIFYGQKPPNDDSIKQVLYKALEETK